VDLLQTWYTLDENSVPPVYVLANLSGDRERDKEYWDYVLPTLASALDGIPFDESRKELLINHSVTEYEAKYAVELSGAMGRDLYWIRRSFDVEIKVTDKEYWNYDDTLENTATVKREHFKLLLSWMQQTFPHETISVDSLETYRLLEPDSKGKFPQRQQGVNCHYEKAWRKCAFDKLTTSLDEIIQRREQWEIDAEGLGIPGAEVAEMLRHTEWAARKLSDFVSREEDVNHIADRVIGSYSSLEGTTTSTTSASTSTRTGGCITLSLVGESGVGKTALMAKVASEIAARQALSYDPSIRDRPVIMRFCGISEGSSTGVGLMRSICRQIGLLKNAIRDDVLKMHRGDLMQHFYSLLRDHPIVLLHFLMVSVSYSASTLIGILTCSIFIFAYTI
jgi:hypothetical protein